MSKYKPKEIKVCAYCGKEFFPRNGMQKYHNEECLKMAGRERNRNRKVIIKCIKCGTQFEVGFKSSRSICDECKKKETEMKKHERKMKSSNRNLYTKKPGHYVPTKKAVPAEEAVKTDPNPIKKEAEPQIEKKEVYARIKIDPSKLIKPYLLERNYGHIPQGKPERPYEDMMFPFRTDGEIPNAGKAFTEEEDIMIEQLVSSGETYSAIAMAFGRSPMQIKSRHMKNVEAEKVGG